MTQSIPTGQIDKSKKLFIASGVLAIAYAVLHAIMHFLVENYFGYCYFANINFLARGKHQVMWGCILEILLFFVLGIYCLAKRKNDVGTAILVGIPILLHIVRFIDYVKEEVEYFQSSEFSYYFLNLSDVIIDRAFPIIIAALLLTLSLLNLQRQHKGEVLLIIACIASGALMRISGIEFYFESNSCRYIDSALYSIVRSFVFPAFVACFGKACIESSPVAQASKPLTFSDGYCDMTKHVLLLLFTFGIWQYLWIYRTTEYLNAAFDDQKRNLATKLLLCMFVPFYYIYWVYQSAKRIDALARQNGVASDISTVSTVLAIFIGFVPPILMQSKLNQICASKGYPAYAASPAPQPAYQAAPQPSYQPQSNYQPQPQTNYQPQSNYQVPAAPAQPTASDTADELRKLKSLLDDGIITPEEFDAKKKQLLGL